MLLSIRDQQGPLAQARRCFELVLPISFLLPDGSIIVIEVREDFALLREWHQDNPNAEGRPELQYPVDIIFRDGTILTVYDEEEMHEARRDCREQQSIGHNGGWH